MKNLLKVKIAKKSVITAWNDENSKVTKVSNGMPHPDFAKAIKSLSAMLAETIWLKAKAKNVTASGIIIHQNDEYDSYEITGQLEAQNGSIVGVTSGKFTQEDNYTFIEKFQETLDEIEKEALAYAYEDKTNQEKLDFPKEDGQKDPR